MSRDKPTAITNRAGAHDFALIVLAAGVMYAVSGGLRANYGIIINPLAEVTGLTYTEVSFAFGVAQLMYGLTQPVWGAVSMKRSSTFSLGCGVILIAAGTIGSPLSHSTAALTLFMGVLFASGAGDYNAAWTIDIFLCLLAAIVSFSIKTRKNE
ncbi:MAG: hypothetical protein ACOYJO_05025 [Eubacterium sp.]|jgi:sugar phosphate permease